MEPLLTPPSAASTVLSSSEDLTSWLSGGNRQTVQIRHHDVTSDLSYFACDQFFSSFKAKHGIDLEPLLLSVIKQHYPEMVI